MGCGQAGFEMNRETLARNRLERDIYMLDLLLDKSWQLGSIGVPTFCPHWFYTCFYHLADNPPPDPWVTEERTLWRWFHNSRAGAGFAWGPWNKGGNGGKWGWIRWGKHPFFPIKLAPPRMEFRNLNPKQQVLHWGPKKWDKPALDFYCIVIVGYILSGFFLRALGGILGDVWFACRRVLVALWHCSLFHYAQLHGSRLSWDEILFF